MRFLLRLREALRPFNIDGQPRKRLALAVVNSHTPMVVLAAAIFAKLRWLSSGTGQPSS
jgi:hypothetical protein